MSMAAYFLEAVYGTSHGELSGWSRQTLIYMLNFKFDVGVWFTVPKA